MNIRFRRETSLCPVQLPHINTFSYAYPRRARQCRGALFCGWRHSLTMRDSRALPHGLSPRSSPKFNLATINCLDVRPYRTGVSFCPVVLFAAIYVGVRSNSFSNSPMTGLQCTEAALFWSAPSFLYIHRMRNSRNVAWEEGNGARARLDAANFGLILRVNFTEVLECVLFGRYPSHSVARWLLWRWIDQNRMFSSWLVDI